MMPYSEHHLLINFTGSVLKMHNDLAEQMKKKVYIWKER